MDQGRGLFSPGRLSSPEFLEFLDALPDATIIVDESGTITSANARTAALFGFERSELSGQKIELLVPDRFAGHAACRNSFFKDPGTREMYSRGQLFARKKNGEEFPVEIQLSSIRGEAGAVSAICAIRDVTEKAEAKRQLQLAAEVFSGSSDGILVLDEDGRVVRINDACTRITGFTLDELEGTAPAFLQFGRLNDASGAGIRQQVERIGRWVGESWCQHKNGEMLRVLQNISVSRDNDGGITNFMFLITDLSESQQADEQINYLVHHDPLTGLPNRSLFYQLGTHALARAQHSPHGHAAVLYLDLDGTQQVNDSCGHEAGDHLLQLVAQRFKERIAEGGIVARVVGDEFAILLEDIGTADDAALTADGILAALDTSFEIKGCNLAISASIGISTYPDDGDSVDALLKHAATAMRAAKRQGKSTYQFYNKRMTNHAIERLRVTNELRRALEREELVAYYQPQFSLGSGQLIGAEALVRWIHPEQGMVSPAQFIPLAEESGLIVPIGEWMLDTVCEQLRDWRRQDLAIPQISVNVAGLQIQQGNLLRLTEAALARNGLQPSDLELEITEGFIMDRATDSLAQLDALKEMGIGLAIDDFGTGYSSLSYLKRLPIDTLKIDRSFVRHLPENSNDRAIVRAIIALGKSMELRLIAEGIETDEQRSSLAEKGCDIGQGFLYSRPVPADEFERLADDQPALA